MANPLPSNLAIGTIGELLVQLRLLQFGVQAAPPLKDSGNDLVALLGYVVRTIQVKCSANGIPAVRRLPQKYHLLALVVLRGHDQTLLLDSSEVYLVPRSEVSSLKRTGAGLEQFRLSQELVHRLFSEQPGSNTAFKSGRAAKRRAT